MTAYFIICGIILSTKHNKKLKEKKKKNKEKTKTQNPPPPPPKKTYVC